MTTKQKIEDCFYNAKISELPVLIDSLIVEVGVEEASEIYATLLLQKFTHFSADTCAKLMEIAIRTNMQIALVKFPVNPFFRLAIFKGSVDLYECYIEEFIQPLLAKNTDEEKNFDIYLDLQTIALKIADDCHNNYHRVIKGLNYNGAFRSDRSGILSINEEDFEIMNALCENYNSIIGRRDILQDLEKKMNEV
ncbi:hypothetical protein [Epilithonimonas hominis]|uniref:Uncharacterized protein n=1 Tax=Epilithonimonas hominis TaxID=420404 RepID=A0A3N0XBR5_9FLAO|nr:hypothetical protein [Epilithonimonas hominis]ROI14814.1 hypothetical protein EGH73_01215 [Epilithonimonas hominis]